MLNFLRTQATYYGTNAVRGCLVWKNIPAKIKSSDSVFELEVLNLKV